MMSSLEPLLCPYYHVAYVVFKLPVNIQSLHQAAECVLCKKQSFATAAGGSRKLSVTDKCPYIKASCAASQA